MSEVLLILLPGAMYFWILFVGQAPMQEMLQEQESLILSRLLACPVTPRQYVLSKMVRCFALCALATTLLLLASLLAFGIHWGTPWRLAVVVAGWALSMAGLLGFLFSLVRTREQSNVLVPLVLVVLAMVGGSMFPYDNLPPFLRALGQYSPNRWAVLALQGAAQAKPLLVFLRPLAGLAAVGTLGFLFAFFLFERRLSGKGRK